MVVRVGAVVAVYLHETVTLEGGEGDACQRAVGGDLLIVDAETVAVGIGVREEARLKDGVCGGFDSWHGVRRRESSLFDFGKVVLRVFIQSKFSESPQREFFLRPSFGKVKD